MFHRDLIRHLGRHYLQTPSAAKKLLSPLERPYPKILHANENISTFARAEDRRYRQPRALAEIKQIVPGGNTGTATLGVRWLAAAFPKLNPKDSPHSRRLATHSTLRAEQSWTVLAALTQLPASNTAPPRCAFPSRSPTISAGGPPRRGRRRGDIMADKANKCAHPVCSCTVSSGKYCSAACEAMEKTPDVDCKCGHPGCHGKTTH